MNNSPCIRTRSRTAGFTLVELLVVVAIVAILGAIAYPGYRSHVVKTQRAAAKACLTQYASLLERHYTTRMSYADDTPGPPACATEGSMDLHYTFSTSGLTATAYTVLATPTATFANRDKDCGTLTLNQAGVKDVLNLGTADLCW